MDYIIPEVGLHDFILSFYNTKHFSVETLEFPWETRDEWVGKMKPQFTLNHTLEYVIVEIEKHFLPLSRRSRYSAACNNTAIFISTDNLLSICNKQTKRQLVWYSLTNQLYVSINFMYFSYLFLINYTQSTINLQW